MGIRLAFSGHREHCLFADQVAGFASSTASQELERLVFDGERRHSWSGTPML